MARGKYAPLATSRSLDALERQVAELQERLTVERDEHAAQQQALAAEVERLRGKLTREVKALSAAAIAAAEQKAADEIARERSTYIERARQVAKILQRDGTVLLPEEWAELARALQCSEGDLVGDEYSNRHGRRARPGKAARVAAAMETATRLAIPVDAGESASRGANHKAW